MKSVKALMAMAVLGSDARFWYQRAQGALEQWAHSIGRDSKQVAAVVAITSPGITVAENISVARQYFETGKVRGHPYGRNIERALNKYFETGQITGPKTGAFYRNLTGDLRALTLDRWMARAMGLKVDTWSQRNRAAAELRLNKVAANLGWEPCEVQAALWHVAMVLADRADLHEPVFMVL